MTRDYQAVITKLQCRYDALLRARRYARGTLAASRRVCLEPPAATRR